MEGRENGIVKAWIESRGMGFITPSAGGDDHFVHRSMLTDGVSLQVGGTITFVPTWDAAKNKPIADQVQGATPAPAGGAPGGAYANPGGGADADEAERLWRSGEVSGAVGMAAMPSGGGGGGVAPAGMATGTVKAWIETRGMGFITPQDGSSDCFVHRSALTDGQSLVVGSVVYFSQGFDVQKNKAIASNVSGACAAQAAPQAPGGWAAPAAAAPTGNDNLYIAGLPADSTEESLTTTFGQYGAVTSVKLLSDNGSPTRVALVRFAQAVQAEWVLCNLNGNIPLGLDTVVQVKYANSGPKGGGKDKGGAPAAKGAYAPAGKGAPAGPSDNLYIAGLPWDSTTETVTSLIGQYGTVTSAKVMDPTPGKPDRVALVRMGSVEEATWIVENLDGNIPAGLETIIHIKFHAGQAGGYGAAKGAPAQGYSPYGKGAPPPPPQQSYAFTPPPKKNTLHIGGLPGDSTIASISTLLGQYGAVTSVRIQPDSSGMSAVIEMGDADGQLGVTTAQWLVENLDGNIPQGLDVPISVKHAGNTPTGQPAQAAQRGPAPAGFVTGTVKHWVQDRGMGFITPDGGEQDCFVHQTNLVDGLALVPGTAVTFKQDFDPQKNKPTATHVTGAVGGDGVGKGAGKYAAFVGKGK